jgi:Zn-dependent M28 family amino/carboxypeptidase
LVTAAAPGLVRVRGWILRPGGIVRAAAGRLGLSTLANINMDAMNPWGRTRSLVSLGYGQTSLEDLLARHAARQGRTVVPDPEPEKGYFYRADHLELARGGVPGREWPTWMPGSEFRAVRESR